MLAVRFGTSPTQQASDGVEASIRRVIDTTLLLAAKQPEGVRAAAVAWFRKELIDGLSGKEEFAGKDLAPSPTLSRSGL